jgi:flagellar hook-associated protein 2
VADGDVISISGTDDNGNSILADFNVTDVTSQTLGDLAEAISDAFGSDVEITVDGGFLTATSTRNGARSFALSVTSDNAGGGSFNVGALNAVTEGRDAGLLAAAVEAGEVVIRSTAYGAAASFDVAFAAGGGDGTGSLGLAAGTYAGTDVQGTIGGEAATGTGRSLTAADGTAADGLVISYTGADTGVVGEFTFTRGIAALVEQVSDQFLKQGEGISGVTNRIDDQITRFNDRIDNIEGRLERRRAALIEQFTRLEESIAEIQARGNFLLSQLASLPQGGGGLL